MAKRNLTNATYQKYCLIIDEWFVNGFNGAAAYVKFYPNIRRDTTAHASFSRLQALPEMKAYIHAKQEEAARMYETTHQGTLNRLKSYLESDLSQSLGMTIEEVKNNLPIEIRSMITGHKLRTKTLYDKEGNVTGKIEELDLQFVSKDKVQEMVNKHIGFYEADNNQKSLNIDLTGMSYEQLKELAKGD